MLHQRINGAPNRRAQRLCGVLSSDAAKLPRFRYQRPLAQAPAVSTAQSETQTVPFEYGYKAEQGKREGMEDELHVYWDEQHGYLYMGCYDGHGGHAAAHWLKQHLHNTVARCMEVYLPRGPGFHLGHNPERPPELTETLIKAFEDADKQLLGHLEELGGQELASAGSTASVAVMRRDRIVLANVGDSQAFLMRNGREINLCTPHRVYGRGPEVDSEIARVKASGGWIHDGRVCNILAVSRAFGDWEFKGKGLDVLLSAGVERGYWPDAFARAQKFNSNPVIVTPDATDTDIVEEDEFFVMSTDGLWDVCPGRDAMQYARRDFLRGMRPAEVAQSLVDTALKRYTSDNTSVVVVDLKGPEYWASKGGGKKAGGAGGLFAGLFGGR